VGQSRFLLPGALAPCLSGLLKCALVILFGTVALAQSGRAPKPTTPPSPVPQPEATAKPTEAKPHTTPGLSLIATRNVPSSNVAIWTGMAFRRFLERLSESPHVKITQEKEMNRKEAADLAKTRTDDYVVWIQLEVDVKMNGTLESDSERASITTINPGCLLISYVVFTPATGKVRNQGRVYQDEYPSICTGTASRPSPLPSDREPRHPVEYTLRKAAREAADRVMTALDIHLPN
jgi:hypothetical protein